LVTVCFGIHIDEMTPPRVLAVTCPAGTETLVKTYDSRKMTRFRSVPDGLESPNTYKRHAKSDRDYI